MVQRLRHWLGDIPINDPIQKQLAGSIQPLLIALLILTGLAVIIPLFVVGTAVFTRGGYGPILIVFLCLTGALLFLRRGHFTAAVALVIGALLLWEAQRVLTAALAGSSAPLLIFLIPITVAGLMLGRRALLLTVCVSVLTLLGMIAVEQSRPSSSDITSASIGSTASQFMVAVSLLAFLLDQVGAAFRKALAAAATQTQALEREVAERRRVELRLRANHSFMEQAQQVAHFGVWTSELALDGKLTWSKEVFRIFGIDEAQFDGKVQTFFACVHPDDLSTVQQASQDALSGLSPYSIDHRVLRPDGIVRWVHEQAEIVPNEQGQPIMIGVVQDITEQKQVEDALRESEQRLRTVLEHMPVMLDAFDENGNLIVWNRECERVTGYTAAELIGNPQGMSLLYPDPNYLNQMLTQWKARGNHYYNWEWELVARDGSVKTIAWSNISEVMSIEGWPTWGVGVDVTERVRAEAALRRANEELEQRVEERTAELSQANRLLQQEIVDRKQAEAALAQERNLLRTLIDNLPDLIFIKDVQGRFILYNSAVERFVGAATSDEIYGKTVYDFSPPKLAAQYEADDRTVLESGQPIVNREEPSADVTGEWRWSSTTKVPLRNLAGEIVGLIGVSRDITARKRVEEALTHERNLLRTMIDLLPDQIFVKDRQSRFLLANRNTTEVMGAASPDELLGKTDFDYYASHIAQPFYDDEQQVIRSEQPMINKTEWNVNPQGVERWFLTSKVPLRNSQGECVGIVGVAHDITERKQAEEQINQLNRDLARRAAELEAANQELEAFTYSVSHDLRAPLRAMDGFSRMVMDDFAPQLPPEATRYLQLVRDNAQQMSELINGLLRLSRLGRQPLRKQQISPADLARRAFDDLRPEMEDRQVEITIGELPSTQADPILLKQVYANLLQNALKFTRPRKETTIEVGFQWDKAQPVYWVKDNGVGFDMRYAHKLFGVFQRMHRAEQFEGAGIGLATVQRIVHRHGGRIWAEAAVDQGATFFFTLGGADDVAE